MNKNNTRTKPNIEIYSMLVSETLMVSVFNEAKIFNTYSQV